MILLNIFLFHLDYYDSQMINYQPHYNNLREAVLQYVK